MDSSRRVARLGVLVIAVVAAAGLWLAPGAGAPEAEGCVFLRRPHTYEADRPRDAYLGAIDAVSVDALFPGDPFFGLPAIETGTRTNRSTASARRIPATLLRALAWVEYSTGMEAALISDLLDLADNPSTRVAPYAYSSDDPPEGLHRALTTYSATQALRHAVDRLTGERKVQAAGAAWHAEPCVRQLCATFEDPVETVRVTDDNFIVVTIRFPSGHLSEAELAFSPRGMSSCSVRRDRGETLSRSHNAWVGGLAMDGILEKLEAAGACLRTGSPEPH